MTVHERQTPPAGNGEVVCVPAFPEWVPAARANALAVSGWTSALRVSRDRARCEALSAAREYSTSIGVASPEVEADALIVMTGHQPELYHPGVWVKDFLVDRAAGTPGVVGIDLVVDTDRADAVTLRAPELGPPVRVREVSLTAAHTGSYAQAPVPTPAERASFRAAGDATLAALPAPAIRRHFTTFCDALDEASVDSADLATALTRARRSYEAPAGTTYLELPVSVLARTRSYRGFAAALLLDAARFREVMNAELADYRTRTGTRSSAQPFPDLACEDGRIEAPFWLLREGKRMTVAMDAAGTVYAEGVAVVGLGSAPDGAVEVIEAADLVFAPKAVALTMFARVFVADLFVHGTGGGRYDRVTDAVIRSYLGIDPPGFAVASMTLLLPLGAHVPREDELTDLSHRLNRLEHNPDTVLDEVEFDTAHERERAHALAREKAALVRAISEPGADRKALGLAIKGINARIAAMLEPVTQALRARYAAEVAAREAAAILADRTYPYCLWDPREVMDKVR